MVRSLSLCTASLVATLLGASVAHADTIFLCRNYGGGEFWSNTHCSKQSALIIRMTSVPSGMPFQQQVDLAAASRTESDKLAAPPAPAQPVSRAPNSPNATDPAAAVTAECQALDQAIRSLDAAARRAQSGPSQDQLTAQRRAARDRQFTLKCR